MDFASGCKTGDRFWCVMGRVCILLTPTQCALSGMIWRRSAHLSSLVALSLARAVQHAPVPLPAPAQPLPQCRQACHLVHKSFQRTSTNASCCSPSLVCLVTLSCNQSDGAQGSAHRTRRATPRYSTVVGRAPPVPKPAHPLSTILAIDSHGTNDACLNLLTI